MAYLGDFRLGDTFDTKFTTRQISGAPSTLGSSPVISAYPSNSTTELTAGITLSVDFDSRTGLNNVRVVATSGNGYATATNYQLVITTGTVNSVSVVGEVIAEFSIENRSALMPTVATRTLDVSATGEAGVDWANVGSPTTALTLTGTTIAVTQKVDIDTIKTNPVVNAGTATFPTNATLASTTNITAGTITTVTTVGTLTTYTGNTPQTGDSYARLGAPAGASVSADITTVINGNGVIFSAVQAAPSAIWTFALTESYSALHAVPTPAQLLFETRSLLAEKAVAGTTMTCKKVDGSTTAMTFTLDSATAPTSIQRAS